MAAFSSLTDRLSNAFKHLKSKGKLSEADIDGTIREIRRALLDADVALDVVRSFTGRIRERALGTEVSQALNPAQQVVGQPALPVGKHRFVAAAGQYGVAFELSLIHISEPTRH